MQYGETQKLGGQQWPENFDYRALEISNTKSKMLEMIEGVKNDFIEKVSPSLWKHIQDKIVEIKKL